MRFPITTSVQPRAADHAYAGRAGAVTVSEPDDGPDTVRVKWDGGDEVTLENVADLRNLSTGG